MKFVSLAVAALLGMVSLTEAIHVSELNKMNKVHKSKTTGRNMISIGLERTNYDNERY